MEMIINQIQEEELTSRGDYFSIALFSDNSVSVAGLEIQRGVGGIYGHPDTGTPPYCVVTADHQTFYGGIERVTWRGTAVDLDLSDRARTALRLDDSHVSLILDMSQSQIERTKTGLKRVFAGGDFQYEQPNLVGFE